MTCEEIAALRDRLQMTQAQLAQVLGVHVLTVSKWECDVLSPTPHQVALLRAFATAADRRPDIGGFVVGALVGAGVAFALFTILQAAHEAPEPHPRAARGRRHARAR